MDNAVADTSAVNLASLFTGVINTLDYYENFSDKPEYWNKLQEQELTFQNELLTAAGKEAFSDPSVYQKKYQDVDFETL